MYPIKIAVFAFILAMPAASAAWAQSDAAAAEAMAEAEAETDGVIAEEALVDEEDAVEGLITYQAADIALDQFLWLKRPIVIIANTPADPSFARQVAYIEEVADQMIERDVVVILDTDPTAETDARQRLRPRGFMLAIVGKDGEIKWRRPSPRSGREIVQTIDKFPLRREEMLEQLPSGRN